MHSINNIMKKVYIIIVSLFGMIGVAQHEDLYPFNHSAKYIVNLFDDYSKEVKISISKKGIIKIVQGSEKINFDITEIPNNQIILINDENNIPAIRFNNQKKSFFLNISQIPKVKREKLFNAILNLQKVIIRNNEIENKIKDYDDDIYKKT